jgi:hypothetical protein
MVVSRVHDVVGDNTNNGVKSVSDISGLSYI